MYHRNPHHRSSPKNKRSKEPPPIDILKLHPPGFKMALSIPFPDRKLPVCLTCKRNYKTRELCRTRDGHITLPWTTTYICITLDKSCIDSDGKLRDDAEFKARSLSVQQPFCFKRDMDSGTAICHACKEKNYTRHYCREKLKHRQLPWPSAYAVLSVPGKDSADKSETAEKTPTNSKEEVKSSTSGDGANLKEESEETKSGDDKDSGKRSPEENEASPRPSKKVKQEADEKGEDDEEKDEGNIFRNIPETSTFLAIVSSSSCSYEWLEIDHSAPAPSRTQREGYSPPSYGEQAYSENPFPGYNQEYPPYYNYPPMMQQRGGPGSYHPQPQQGYGSWGGGYGYNQQQAYPPSPEQQAYPPYPPYPYYSSPSAGPYQPSPPYQPMQSSSGGGHYQSQPPPMNPGGNFEQSQSQNSSNVTYGGSQQGYPYHSQYGAPNQGTMRQSFHQGQQQFMPSMQQQQQQQGGLVNPDHQHMQDHTGYSMQDQGGHHISSGGMQNVSLPVPQAPPNIPPPQQQQQQHGQLTHPGDWAYPPHQSGSPGDH